MKRCTKCILPESFPGIVFNEDDTCQFCLDKGTKPVSKGMTPLFDRIKSEIGTSEYDCVVPLSGGKDSTLVLYYAKEELGLNPIAVNYDSGFQSELAKKNIKKSCDTLNIPLVIKKADRKIQHKILREILLVSEILGHFIRTCINCEIMIRTAALDVASEYRVPFIFWGSSSSESTSSSSYEQYRYGKSISEIIKAKIKAFQKLQLTPLQIARLLPRVSKYYYLSIRQKQKMNVPYKYVFKPFGARPFPENRPATIHVFDYIPWNPKESARILRENLGWEHPEKQQSRFDCQLYCFAQHKSLTMNGITKGGIIESNLIRQGLLGREDVLKMEEEAQESIVQECNEMLRKLDLNNYNFPSH